jgi:hypothetical protein
MIVILHPGAKRNPVTPLCTQLQLLCSQFVTPFTKYIYTHLGVLCLNCCVNVHVRVDEDGQPHASNFGERHRGEIWLRNWVAHRDDVEGV